MAMHPMRGLEPRASSRLGLQTPEKVVKGRQLSPKLVSQPAPARSPLDQRWTKVKPEASAIWRAPAPRSASPRPPGNPCRPRLTAANLIVPLRWLVEIKASSIEFHSWEIDLWKQATTTHDASEMDFSHFKVTSVFLVLKTLQKVNLSMHWRVLKIALSSSRVLQITVSSANMYIYGRIFYAYRPVFIYLL